MGEGILNNVRVAHDENGNTIEKGLDYAQCSLGEPDQPANPKTRSKERSGSGERRVSQPSTEVPVIKYFSLERPQPRRKNLGRLQEPKQINVVKNDNFDIRQNPISLLGDPNKDIAQSIGSGINEVGSIHSPK